MIRHAGFLRKLPDDDNLYLTIENCMVWIRGDDIPHMLAGEEQPLYHNQHKAGTIRVRTRTGYPDLIVVKLHNMHYIIWRDQFERVRAKDLKFAKIQERIPECWAEFRQQGVTA